MTLKHMMLGSAIAALVAGGAIAQSADTPTSEPDTSTEAPMTDNESTTEMDSTTDSSDAADTTMESEPTADSAATPDTSATMAPEGGADAQGNSDVLMGTESDMAENPATLNEMTVDQVLGTNVVGIEDEAVGEVDYVIEQPDGLAFVVGVGGFLGLGEYTVAIPADQFTVNEDGDLALSSMTKEDLKALPEFDEDDVEGLEGDAVIGDLM